MSGGTEAEHSVSYLFFLRCLSVTVSSLAQNSRISVDVMDVAVCFSGFSLKQSNVNHSQDEIYGDLPALAKYVQCKHVNACDSIVALYVM